VKANFRSGELIKSLDKIEEGRIIQPNQNKERFDGVEKKRFHVVVNKRIYNQGIEKLKEKFKDKKFNIDIEFGKLLESAIKSL